MFHIDNVNSSLRKYVDIFVMPPRVFLQNDILEKSTEIPTDDALLPRSG